MDRRKVLTKAVIRSIVASDEKARAWLNSENRALGARPIDLLPRAEGLIRVLLYLDSARGQGSLPELLSPPRARPKALPTS